MSPIVRVGITYTLLRVAVFAVCVFLLRLAGLHSLPLVLVALLVSGVVSYPIGRRQRDALVAAWQERHGPPRR
jgi:Protein of unknown function (DUF4229)